MLETFFQVLETIGDFIWSFPALLMILVLGLYFTIKTGFFQVRKFPAIVGQFSRYVGRKDQHDRGVHPLKAFFASIGGAIGIGNVVVILVAIQVGGPGAIFWAWVIAGLGMTLKYGEVYLGIKYRRKNAHGSYDGGPMYYLQKAFRVRWVAVLFAFLLCLYGVEVYMFSELTYTISLNWHIDRYMVALVLLALVIWAGLGGVRRVGNICSAIVPVFVVIYVGMCAWVLLHNLPAIPGMFALIFKSAFTGHAAMGGFAGATVLMATSQGAARGSYSGDIGIGYASVIQAETSTTHPERQASLAVFGIFLDTFIVCTSSVLLVLVTDVWTEVIPAGQLVQTALTKYFPYMNLFMPFFMFLLVYSTLTAYFVVGLKCADFLAPKHGKKIYMAYAVIALVIFSFVEPSDALIVMTLAGGLLLLTNLSGIFVLRKEIEFKVG
jgi:alanine or glycine:cation symporter, AGCS family